MNLHRLVADDWEKYRDLRLSALADSPHAFGESLTHARQCTEIDWRARLARMHGDRAIGLVVTDADGTWTGTARSEVSGDEAWVYGVYVAPRFRRAGVAQLLLTTIAEWASIRAGRMLLHVATTNDPARRFYERFGFEATGRSIPNPVHPDITEMELARSLAGFSAPEPHPLS